MVGNPVDGDPRLRADVADGQRTPVPEPRTSQPDDGASIQVEQCKSVLALHPPQYDGADVNEEDKGLFAPRPSRRDGHHEESEDIQHAQDKPMLAPHPSQRHGRAQEDMLLAEKPSGQVSNAEAFASDPHGDGQVTVFSVATNDHAKDVDQVGMSNKPPDFVRAATATPIPQPMAHAKPLEDKVSAKPSPVVDEFAKRFQVEAPLTAGHASTDCLLQKSLTDVGNGPEEIPVVVTTSPKVTPDPYSADDLPEDIALLQDPNYAEQPREDSEDGPHGQFAKSGDSVMKVDKAGAADQAQGTATEEDDDEFENYDEMKKKLVHQGDYAPPVDTPETNAEREKRAQRRGRLRDEYLAENMTSASTSDASTATTSSATASQEGSGSSGTRKRGLSDTKLQLKGPPRKSERKVLGDEYYTPGTLVWVKIEHYPHWPCMIMPPEAYFFLKEHDLEKRIEENCVIVHFLNDGCLAEVSKVDCLQFYEWKHLADYNQQQRELNGVDRKVSKKRRKAKKKEEEDFGAKVEMAYQQAIVIYNIYGNMYPRKPKHFEDEVLDSSAHRKKRAPVNEVGGTASNATVNKTLKRQWAAILRANAEAWRAKEKAMEKETEDLRNANKALQEKLDRIARAASS